MLENIRLDLYYFMEPGKFLLSIAGVKPYFIHLYFYSEGIKIFLRQSCYI